MGDYHVRICERLAGESPACLLGPFICIANGNNEGFRMFHRNCYNIPFRHPVIAQETSASEVTRRIDGVLKHAKQF